jgi:hypothetical protein
MKNNHEETHCIEYPISINFLLMIFMIIFHKTKAFQLLQNAPNLSDYMMIDQAL